MQPSTGQVVLRRLQATMENRWGHAACCSAILFLLLIFGGILPEVMHRHQLVLRRLTPFSGKGRAAAANSLQFPKRSNRDPNCGVSWQDSYRSLHEGILSGTAPQRFAVAVGVEAGLTGRRSCNPIPCMQTKKVISNGWYI